MHLEGSRKKSHIAKACIFHEFSCMSQRSWDLRNGVNAGTKQGDGETVAGTVLWNGALQITVFAINIKGLWLEKSWFAQHTCSFNSCLNITWLFEANCKRIIFGTSPWQCERSIPSFLCVRLSPYMSCIDLDYFMWDTDLNLILTSLPRLRDKRGAPRVCCTMPTVHWEMG